MILAIISLITAGTLLYVIVTVGNKHGSLFDLGFIMIFSSVTSTLYLERYFPPAIAEKENNE